MKGGIILGKEDIGSRILLCIKEVGITKTAFAEKLNLSQPYVSQLCLGNKTPSDRTILDICREFGVRESWLRTGEGEMFVRKSRTDEIAAFMGGILQGEPDFRQRFIAVLSRMTPEEWAILEKKVLELAEEMKKTGP